MKLHGYRLFPSSAAAGEVIAELLSRPVAFLVVVRPSGGPEPFHYTFPVDARLFELLSAHPESTPIERVLDLHEWMASRRSAFPQDHTKGFESLLPGPAAVVSDTGHVVGIDAGEEAPEHALYPDLQPSSPTVAPGDVVEVTVRLADRPAQMMAPRIDVVFPDGVSRVSVRAVVTEARGFERPEGEEWRGAFTVETTPGGPVVSPSSWKLRARAVPAKRHELTVTFFGGAAAAGLVTVTFGERAAGDADPLPALSATPVAVRPPRAGATMVLTSTPVGPVVQLLEDGEPAASPFLWDTFDSADLARLCNALQAAADLKAARDVGLAIWTQLPKPMRDWLVKSHSPGAAPLTILSNEPLLPFEAAVLADVAGAPILGVERPVVRWIPTAAELGVQSLDVGRAVCIRPDYNPVLETAHQEELRFAARFPGSAHAGTADEIRAVLERSDDVPLIHYAGHAKGAPSAGLQLPGGVLFGPVEFAGRPLLSHAHPFVFLNGCQAGFATPQPIAAYSNFPWTLLAAHASGVVASLLRLIQEAAPLAADTFYDAVLSNETVGEALRRVRELALHAATPAHAASFLSYLAYGSPELRLRAQQSA